ncbi:AraC family transcriptional regulator [Aliifodinibius sp. S!AR15-10]|uniref:AraC family transcriptional regulator n=1 Tax=Aliifodinibius sp. S!AR15-10 TaxID=2950437 RepID=UPI00285F1D32|nr:AraC family transcriptional regulator [Aliifodinibius sp. S!AR15-10]MDR8389542.1 AraC family transcriptional regulator [Aliifodinibius sp. S!AR15-10]
MIPEERKREGFLGQKMVVLPQNVRNAIQDNPIINKMYVTDIGYYPYADHHYRKREEGSEEYILIYCLEGHGWIELGTEHYELVPNSYFIIPRNTAHKYGAREDDPWSIYWIHFAGSSATQFYKKYKQSDSSNGNAPQVVQIPFEERRIKYFNGIISLLESGYSREIVEYVNISLWQLLASFVYNEFFSEIRHQSNETNIVDTAINYMKENLDRSISVDELAEHLNYSSSYLYSLFKEETGYSPIHYFNHLKIQKACQYLSFTNMSIKEISYELGFNDPFYFSRLFKKLMELSPTEYREEL